MVHFVPDAVSALFINAAAFCLSVSNILGAWVGLQLVQDAYHIKHVTLMTVSSIVPWPCAFQHVARPPVLCRNDWSASFGMLIVPLLLLVIHTYL